MVGSEDVNSQTLQLLTLGLGSLSATIALMVALRRGRPILGLIAFVVFFLGSFFLVFSNSRERPDVLLFLDLIALGILTGTVVLVRGITRKRLNAGVIGFALCLATYFFFGKYPAIGLALFFCFVVFKKPSIVQPPRTQLDSLSHESEKPPPKEAVEAN